MQTTEHLLDAVKQLPKDEQRKFLAKLAELELDKNDDGEGGISNGWQELLSLAGSVNRGKVHVPFPDREMLYEDR